jgi:2',3'-cyclic-nucleotide 2'-phosphodiesterase (5'-nucleotidase family)
VLLLDCGDAFNPKIVRYPKLQSEVIFKAMEHMKYDAMNVAEGDLSLGDAFFQKVSKNTSISLLSATLHRPGSHQLMYRPYVVKRFGKIRVGVIGATASVFYRGAVEIKGDAAVSKDVEILKKLIPEVRRKADIVVLLSHFGYPETMHLIQTDAIKGVDVAVVGHGTNILETPVSKNGIILVQNSANGEYLGMLQLDIDRGGQVGKYTGKLIPLSMDIPEEAWTQQVVKKNDENMMDKRLSERKMERATRYLKLPPGEALKRLEKQEKGK